MVLIKRDIRCLVGTALIERERLFRKFPSFTRSLNGVVVTHNAGKIMNDLSWLSAFPYEWSQCFLCLWKWRAFLGDKSDIMWSSEGSFEREESAITRVD